MFTTDSNECLKVLRSRDELADQDPETQDLESVLRDSDDKVKVHRKRCKKQIVKCFQALVGHSGAIFGISISPRRDFLITGGEDGTVRLWSLLVYQCIIVHRGHMWPIWDVTFAPFGHYFASCGMDRFALLSCFQL